MFSKVDKRTEETLLKHLQAFASGDVDAIMDDYDETSVLSHRMVLSGDERRSGRSSSRLYQPFHPARLLSCRSRSLNGRC